MSGVKEKEGKPPYSLLNLWALGPTVQVLAFGADKYPSPMNWQGVEPIYYFDAAMRHLADMQNGEWLDKQSGLPHLAHAVCDLIFLSWFERKGAFTAASFTEKRPEQQDLRQPAQSSSPPDTSALYPTLAQQRSIALGLGTIERLEALKLRRSQLFPEFPQNYGEPDSVPPGFVKGVAGTPTRTSSTQDFVQSPAEPDAGSSGHPPRKA